MRVWITRSQPGADRTAEKLRVLGHEPIVGPLLEARPIPGALDLSQAGALAFTSGNGVRAFATLSRDRGLPVFTVGAATAAAARQAGFSHVMSADGDVAALARLIYVSRDRFAGEVLIATAKAPAGDLARDLIALGVRARAQPVYETVPTEPLPVTTGAEAVLIHSPRAARRLVEARLASSRLAAYCISANAAAPLDGAGFWKIVTAPHPDEDSLLALLPGGIRPPAP